MCRVLLLRASLRAPHPAAAARSRRAARRALRPTRARSAPPAAKARRRRRRQRRRRRSAASPHRRRRTVGRGGCRRAARSAMAPSARPAAPRRPADERRSARPHDQKSARADRRVVTCVNWTVPHARGASRRRRRGMRTDGNDGAALRRRDARAGASEPTMRRTNEPTTAAAVTRLHEVMQCALALATPAQSETLESCGVHARGRHRRGRRRFVRRRKAKVEHAVAAADDRAAPQCAAGAPRARVHAVARAAGGGGAAVPAGRGAAEEPAAPVAVRPALGGVDARVAVLVARTTVALGCEGRQSLYDARLHREYARRHCDLPGHAHRGRRAERGARRRLVQRHRLEP